MKSFIRDFDEIYPPSVDGLHFKGDTKQKSFIGGLASFAVTVFVIFFVYGNGRKMFLRDDPTLSSLAEELIYESVAVVPIKKVGKILFQVLENGYSTVNLDAVEGGYRQYIHIRLLNHIYKYNADKGKHDVIEKIYDLERCQASNFEGSDFEKQYFDLYSKYDQYCIDQLDEVFLQGTKESFLKLQDYAYITYEVYRCN